MNKLVYTVFSTLAFAIIFVFVWDIVFYLYRVNSLNTRIENISSAMQNVVMQNNYMPKAEAQMFQQLLVNMANDYNASMDKEANDYAWGSTKTINDFILYMDWNYNDSAQIARGVADNITDSRSRVHTKMGVGFNETVPDYGDITVIQLRVVVAQPTWNFMQQTGAGFKTIVAGDTGLAHDEENNHVTNVGDMFQTELDYTYYVPCLRYKATWKN